MRAARRCGDAYECVACLSLIRRAQDAGVAAAARTATESVLLAVDESSVDDVVRELVRGLDDDSAGCRAATASVSGFYFKSMQAALEEHVPPILGTHKHICDLERC